jgi:sortase A
MSASPVEVPQSPPQSPPRGPAAKAPLTPRRLPVQPGAAKQLAPRGAAWWWGAALLTIGILLLSFVAYATTFSWLQYNSAQSLEYNQLRSSLAQATTPVGQLDFNKVLVTPGTPVALLSIPSIGVSEVVAEGTTGSVLRSGPGHRRDTVMPGQAGVSVIMGRQTTFGGPFGSISQLVPGNTITVTTGQGLNTFRVIDVRHQNDPPPTAIPVSGGRLELITADGLPLLPAGGLYVDAELVSKVQTTPTLVMSYPALPVEERAMGQDTSAWAVAGAAFALFLAVGLVLAWLWRTWGRRQAWLIGVPIMVVLAATVADQVLNALPNLI